MGDDDEPSDDDDDDDTDDEDEEPFEDEEEEHLAPADPSAVPVVDHVPSAGDTEAFETDETVLDLEPPHVTHPWRSVLLVCCAPATTNTPLSTITWSPSLSQLPFPPLSHSPLSLHLPLTVPHIDLPLPSSLTTTTTRLIVISPPVRIIGRTIPEASYHLVRGYVANAPTSMDVGAEEVGALMWHLGMFGRTRQLLLRMDRQTQLFQSVDGLVEDRHFHYETARLLDREALVSREAWAHSVGLSSAVHYELQAYRTHTQMQDYRIASQESLMTTLIAQNNMPPRRSSATARAATAAAATPMTAAAVEQLIEARVSAALANHETLRNSTNGHGDGSHNSETGIRGTVRTPRECTYKDFLNCKPLTFKGTEGVVVLSQWFKKMKEVFHISNCVVENQDVAYAMDWKALKKMMTVKYCPRGEIKKLEIELWNLKVKEEVEKYVGGLPDMIR
ncbi:hypothetical protein Tco_0534704 [Tanacetum coccineum]